MSRQASRQTNGQATGQTIGQANEPTDRLIGRQQVTTEPGHFTPKSSGTFVSFDGTEIYYETRGEGEPLIFVYGIACLMNHFHHQIDYFSKRNQVITFDLRGHNRSSAPKNLQHMTVRAMAEDLLALIEHLNVGRAHFVGHSFGVPVLIQYSKLTRRHNRSFVFINGFARNPIQGMFGLDLVDSFFKFGKKTFRNYPRLVSHLWKSAVQNPLAGVVAGLVGGFNLVQTEWKDIEIYARAVAEMPLDTFIPLFEDMMRFNDEDAVKKITTPTLVLAGDNDLVTPLHFQEDLHKMIPGSKFVVVPRGSHCTQLDFPGLVNFHIEQHIDHLDFT
ncbi:MAG: alpha/beta hydrolase [Bdellovibrio sp.]|nr:MAG: alpha/beta hydrolase [Bdellovibrio sp.]